ncbi:MAG: glycosyltransferase family 1 protein [Prevotella sp.]|uniref:glycosyltransferase family 4 protein n=1 Tax=Prevotella sp. TaxID=59823 RepID=UPI00258D11E1|nr:glycosyltransferase family 1 protein [Prevotella sp.]MDD6853757.1 glycosyltransferase family 1 protein [Prevotella sp.]
MRKILIDATYIQKDRLFDAVSIYIFRLLKVIPSEEIPYYKLLVLPEIELYIKKKFPEFQYITYNPYKKSFLSGRLSAYIKSYHAYKKAVNRSNCDILFVPDNYIMFTCAKVHLPKIEVIHDIPQLDLIPRFSFASITNRIYYKLLHKNASKLIAISNFTKQDILKHFKYYKENEIKVVYNSIEPIKEEKCPKIITGFNKPFILYVNALKKYKNLITLIKAFCLIKDKTNSSIVIVGRETDYWKREIVPLIKKQGIENRIIHLQNIPNEELKYLYCHASLFVTTSTMEGFGYTPIEAAMNMCPVISTKVKALPDTTMNLLNYYDPPTDEYVLAKKMLEQLSSSKDINKLKNISEAFKERYSPKKQYDQFKEIFNSL